MGKNKIQRWAELGTFNNVLQPETNDISGQDHRIKGKWREEIFRNENPVVLELGCGKGEYTMGLSEIFPEKNFVGIDIKGARMWRGAKTASENQSANVAFLRTRIEFIHLFFSKDEADEIWITFPDPHPVKRNSNKRLTCPWFLNKYRNILKNNGIIHLKTDNRELFDYTGKIAGGNGFEILFSTGDLYSVAGAAAPGPGKVYLPDTNIIKQESFPDQILSIKTHYEKIFLTDGLKICYLAFRVKK